MSWRLHFAAQPLDSCRPCANSLYDFRQGSHLAHRVEGFVETTASEIPAFRLNKDFRKHAQLLQVAAARVSRGEMTKSAFSELKSASGFKFNPHGIALCQPLRPYVSLPDVINYDWVHSALQGGAFTTEVEALLVATKVPRSDLQQFLSSSVWQYPGRTSQKSRYLHRVFDSRRVANDEPDKLKASCSELLGIYGILRVFFEMRYSGVDEFRLQLDSFGESCKVLDTILEFKRGWRPISAESVAELQATMQRHLQKHIAVYGCSHIIPKHHWLIDTAAQFLQDTLVLDAFVIERTHLAVKSIADFVKNTICYERSVLTGIVCSLGTDEDLQRTRLVGPIAHVPGSAACVGDRAVVFGLEYQVGEVILRGEAAGLLKACAVEAGELFFLVQSLQLAREVTRCCGSHGGLPGLLVWPAREVCHSVAWRVRTDGTLFVVCR